MPPAWTADNIRAAELISQYFPNARVVDVINHKENPSMTEQDQDENMWQGEDGQDEATRPNVGGATYPEYPYSLADHVYTWSPKLPDGSMLVIRAQSADALLTAVESVAPLAGRLTAAWRQATGAPAPQAPPQGYGAPQGSPNYNPQMPPPNMPYPGQPAWQQAGAPQAQGAPQWGGGQQAAPSQRKEYPAPQGWYKLNVPFPGGKDQLHALAQSQGIPKGNPNKGGAYNFFGLTPGGQPGKAWYCSPQVAPAFAQFQPTPA